MVRELLGGERGRVSGRKGIEIFVGVLTDQARQLVAAFGGELRSNHAVFEQVVGLDVEVAHERGLARVPRRGTRWHANRRS